MFLILLLATGYCEDSKMWPQQLRTPLLTPDRAPTLSLRTTTHATPLMTREPLLVGLWVNHYSLCLSCWIETLLTFSIGRSSSCRPEPLVHIVALQDSKSPIFPSGSHQEMHSMIGCQFVELCKEPLSIDDSNSNTRSMFDISANFRPQQMIFSFGEDQ